MSVAATRNTLDAIAAFIVDSAPPAAARVRAMNAFLDTVGVTLAGASEPASKAVQATVAANGGGACTVLGTSMRGSAGDAALANGTAAHALDYDDMCFVSLAHPSAPLVSALLAAGETTGASGALLADAYVIGFEIEARLGRVMNPRSYQRGWHCTSTIGTIGSAAAVSRVVGLDASRTAYALAIAASAASGLKENFGTMVKPLHAGLAARDAVLAAMLAKSGMTASARALDGPQGYLRAMDSERDDLDREVSDLGTRWEILDTGVTVKLYPSCAATHPPLDALLALCRTHGLTADVVDRVEIDVDAITPTVLLYDRPVSGLEAKFSMPFCGAAAVVEGRIGIDTFSAGRVTDPRITSFMPHVALKIDPELGLDRPPLTQARVRVFLLDGGVLTATANGARGYPDNPASDAELDEKFLACATRTVARSAAAQALSLLRAFNLVDNVRELTTLVERRC